MSEHSLIRPESNDDQQAIWKVNQSAFGVDDEANLVEQLRNGGFVDVSLVAEVNGKIVGHILFSRVSISSASIASVLRTACRSSASSPVKPILSKA